MGTEVELTPEAKKLWVRFYNGANEEAAGLEGPAKAAYIKGVSYGARLALILHLAEAGKAQGAMGEVEPVSAENMRWGLILAKWLRNETLRVYEALGLAKEVLPPRQRFLSRLPGEFRTKEAKALAEEDGIPERTCEYWLRKLFEKGDLEKVRRGLYRKPSPTADCGSCGSLHEESADSMGPVKETATTANRNGLNPKTGAPNAPMKASSETSNERMPSEDTPPPASSEENLLADRFAYDTEAKQEVRVVEARGQAVIVEDPRSGDRYTASREDLEPTGEAPF